ncbi:MAG: hypothetical protein HY796_01170 [Elusimicrobia bacterium]|nr:hypothetical protein [Elusimicrobiota bacterium]
MLNSRAYAVCVRLGLVAVIGMCFSGCQDKATPGYAQCVQLDIKGDIGGAWAACNAAISADPSSENGKAAAAKLIGMKPTYDQWKTEHEKQAAMKALGIVKNKLSYDGHKLGGYLEESAKTAVEESNMALGSNSSRLVNSWAAYPLGNDRWQINYAGHIGSDFDGRPMQSEYIFEVNTVNETVLPANPPAKMVINGPPKKLNAPSKKRK